MTRSSTITELASVIRFVQSVTYKGRASQIELGGGAFPTAQALANAWTQITAHPRITPYEAQRLSVEGEILDTRPVSGVDVAEIMGTSVKELSAGGWARMILQDLAIASRNGQAPSHSDRG